MTTNEPSRTQWLGRWGFVLAATGSAVGLGNIWKFPYMTGEYGGGAFVLVYLLCVLAVGVPIMIAEILIGRRARLNPMDAMGTLAAQHGPGDQGGEEPRPALPSRPRAADARGGRRSVAAQPPRLSSNCR